MFPQFLHTPVPTHVHSLQKFKLNIANTVISQENSSLSSMNTSDLLGLFQLSTTAADKGEQKVGVASLWNDYSIVM